MASVEPLVTPGLSALAAAAATPGAAPVLDVVVPVHNEEDAVGACVERLHRHLVEQMPYPWRITVVDNASTDATVEVARGVARGLDRVRVLSLPRKGRGYALRHAWTSSDAAVLAYMDVDLSTGLDALLPLVAPLVSGNSDLAIGSRLVGGASVARGPRRELVSRCYNLILRGVFATRFHDAQCGFKAIRADAAAALLPHVVDDNWFFDTELLLLAEHNGLRVHEVAVDWVDDPDSSVDVVSTAREDLAGVRRVAWEFLSGRGRIDDDRYHREPVEERGRRLVVFGLIGAASTAVSLAVFLATRSVLGAVVANAVAVSSTAVVNAWANRRYTFGRRGRLGRAADYLRAAGIYVCGLAFSTAGLWALGPDAGRLAELLTVVGSWALASVCRFAVLDRKDRP